MRGMGKTSVLLTLKRLTERDQVGQPLPQPENPGLYAELRSRLVWLEPIDMEALTEPTNLLAATLARIDEAVRALSPGGEPEDYRGFLDHTPEHHMALSKLHELENNVALAWDGNLGSRGAHVDPDTFAVEVMRTERARLALNRHLRNALDELAARFFSRNRSASENPLFVLPVDDFDLNPLRCLDMLRVVRMISVPRLFTLVLGDERVAETIFNLKLSGDLARLVGSRGGARDLDLMSLPADEVKSMAGEIAANALRKLIPPAQIVRLESLTIEESLGYIPPSVPREESRSGSQPDKATLAEIWKSCSLNAETSELLNVENFQQAYRSAHLHDFFFMSLFDYGIEAARVVPFPRPLAEHSYTGLAILRTSPRRVADLWQELEPLRKAPPAGPGGMSPAAQPDGGTRPVPAADWARRCAMVRRIIDVFGNFLQRTIAEDIRLTPGQRQRLLDAIQKNLEGHLELDTKAYRVHAIPGPDYYFDLTQNTDPGKGEKLLSSATLRARLQSERLAYLRPGGGPAPRPRTHGRGGHGRRAGGVP
jgi:hypothetical protein